MDAIGNRTLRDLWEERVIICPDKTFLVYEDLEGNVEEFTYEEFIDFINRTANGLLNLGIKKGDKVTVHMRNYPEYLAIWFGLAKIGAVMVPSIVSNTEKEMEYLINFSEAVAIITRTEYLPMINNVLGLCSNVKKVILVRAKNAEPGTMLFEDVIAGMPNDVPSIDLDSEDDMEMVFTSGTTAQPKAVQLTHANALWSILRAPHCQEDDRWLTALPVFHVNCQLTVLSVIGGCATLNLIEAYSASRFWDQVVQHKATATTLVATLVRTLLRQQVKPNERDHCLRRLAFAINVTDREKEEFESRFGISWSNGYGLTEAYTAVVMDPPGGLRKWPSIGLPTVDREIRIVDDSGNEVPRGQIGELIVKGVPGRTIMKGYFKNPEATRQTIKNGWLYTGDNVYMDEKGYFYFVDRKKDIIKRGAENISASEVEMVVSQHPKVAESAVIAVPDPVKDEAVKVFVLLKEGETATEEEIIEYCKQHLAKFKVPSFVEFRTSFPRTSIGKVEKKTLRKEEEDKRKQAVN